MRDLCKQDDWTLSDGVCAHQKRALDPLELELTEDCQPLYGCWELNPGRNCLRSPELAGQDGEHLVPKLGNQLCK